MEKAESYLGRVASFIRDNMLLEDGQKVLVGLSGGADSVALALMLAALGYEVHAVHCNFHLREEESDRDEAFVRTFCHAKGIFLDVAQFDTVSYAKENSLSIEMAARNLRYGYFRNAASSMQISSIAVAHHGNDQAETVLLNIIRGSGIHGLRGMLPRNGQIIRPLLCLEKSDILSYLSLCGEDYVTDSTNLKDDCKRNFLRLDVIPLLEKANPSFIQSICQMASRLRDTENMQDVWIKTYLDSHLRKIMPDAFALDISVKSEPFRRTVLHEWLSPYGFFASQMDDIITTDRAGSMFFSDSMQLELTAASLVLSRKDVEEQSVEISSFPQKVHAGGAEFSAEIIPAKDCMPFLKDPSHACLDLSRLSLPLVVRTAGQNDVFRPFGMKNMKNVWDFLSSAKVPGSLRSRQIVCEDHNGRICWVAGMRTDDRFRITDKTENVLLLSMSADM